jgi:hypothetical protein
MMKTNYVSTMLEHDAHDPLGDSNRQNMKQQLSRIDPH